MDIKNKLFKFKRAVHRNREGIAKTVSMMLVVALVIGGCWMLSSAAPVPNSAGGFFEDAFELKFTDTLIYVTYLVGGASLLAILAGEIRNAIK